MLLSNRRPFSALASSLVVALVATLALASCGDGAGTGPTAPPPPAIGGSAVVSGQVTGVSGSAVAATAAPSPSGALAPGEISALSADSGSATVTVRIQGTGLSTTSDAQGGFSLGGVPSGNQVVLFESGSATAPLPIPEIQSGERIELMVELQGSTVQVQSMSRSGDGGEPVELTLEMQPDTWNTNWAGSSGTVSALIRGDGLEGVDLGSIVLVGSDPAAAPLAPTRVDLAGNHVRAFFSQADALATLDDPQPGELHTVTVELTVDGEPLTLTAVVRIVGPGSGGEASVDLEKATQGQDADVPPGPTIAVGDPVDWTYVVTNTGGVALSAVTVTDDQGVAVDCPAAALEPGESMTCTGSGTAEPGQYANLGLVEASAPERETVGDEDPSHYFGEEAAPAPVELSLDMQPDAWNTNWESSSGTVSALIRGQGFEAVDLDSIVLVGSDPAAAPLEPTRVDRAGNHVRAFFAKSAAIAILDDPRPGEVHEVTVELTVDGAPLSLSDEVRVVGPAG